MDFDGIYIELKNSFNHDYDMTDTLEEDQAALEAFVKQRNAEWHQSGKSRAKHFLDCDAKYLKYPVIKACTWLDADPLPPWEENWLGMSWVAFRGVDSLCVVTLENDLVQLDGGDTPTLEKIWNALVNEVEGIEDRISEGVCKRPFSVVAVIKGTSELGSQFGKRAEYRAKKTIKFLQKEMKSGSIFSFDKTIQTAISAFQHLHRREFKAHEIRAFAWKDGDALGKELMQRRENPDLDEVLASINDPDNDLDKFTLKKCAAPMDFMAPEIKGRCKNQLLRCHTFHPPAAVTFLQEVGLRRCSNVGQGDGSSRFTGKLKAPEKTTHPKKRRKSLDQRRQQRKKVKKSSSSELELELAGKDVHEKGDLDNDALMQESNMEEELVEEDQ